MTRIPTSPVSLKTPCRFGVKPAVPLATDRECLPPLPSIQGAQDLVTLWSQFSPDFSAASRSIEVQKKDEVRAAAILDYLYTNDRQLGLTAKRLEGPPKQTQIYVSDALYLVVMRGPEQNQWVVRLYNTRSNPQEPVYDTGVQLARIAKLPISDARNAMRQRILQTAQTAWILKQRLAP